MRVNLKFLCQNYYLFQSYLKIFIRHTSQSCSMLKFSKKDTVNLQYHWVVPFHAEACSWEMSLMRQHFSCFFIANFTHFYFLGSEIFQSRTQFCVKVYERDYMISSSIISPKEAIWFPLLLSLLKKLTSGTKPDISKLSEGHQGRSVSEQEIQCTWGGCHFLWLIYHGQQVKFCPVCTL